MVIVPVRTPAELGLNVPVIVQFAVSVPEHGEFIWKSGPLSATWTLVMVPESTLIVTPLEAETLFTSCGPKSRTVRRTDHCGGGSLIGMTKAFESAPSASLTVSVAEPAAGPIVTPVTSADKAVASITVVFCGIPFQFSTAPASKLDPKTVTRTDAPPAPPPGQTYE